MSGLFQVPDKHIRLRHIPWLLFMILLGTAAALLGCAVALAIGGAIALFTLLPIFGVLWLRHDLTDDIKWTIFYSGAVEAAIVFAYWYMTKPENSNDDQ